MFIACVGLLFGGNNGVIKPKGRKPALTVVAYTAVSRYMAVSCNSYPTY